MTEPLHRDCWSFFQDRSSRFLRFRNAGLYTQAVLRQLIRPLLYLLMFQLALGMQGSIAFAAAFASPHHLSGMHAAGCDEHMGSHQVREHSQPRAAGHSGSGSSRHALGDHHCCGSDGCQCHTPSTPAVPLAIGRLLPVASTSLLPERAQEFPAAPVSQRLRPPIA